MRCALVPIMLLRAQLLLVVLLSMGFLVGCASTKVADVQPGYRNQSKDLDEAGLWFAMDRAEKTVAAAPDRKSVV